MSTHNIGFLWRNKQSYHLIIIKYHQIRTLFLLLTGDSFFTSLVLFDNLDKARCSGHRLKQITRCFEPFQKLRAKLGP